MLEGVSINVKNEPSGKTRFNKITRRYVWFVLPNFCVFLLKVCNDIAAFWLAKPWSCWCLLIHFAISDWLVFVKVRFFISLFFILLLAIRKAVLKMENCWKWKNRQKCFPFTVVWRSLSPPPRLALTLPGKSYSVPAGSRPGDHGFRHQEAFRVRGEPSLDGPLLFLSVLLPFRYRR